MDDLAPALEIALVGRSCRVERREAGWSFDLQDGTGLAVECHWRLVSSESIALTDEDDGQRFGLLEAVDAEAKANALLVGATISSATIDRVTADLRLGFSNGLRLELISNSSGYEGWQASFNHAGQEVSIVAMGGGRLAYT